MPLSPDQKYQQVRDAIVPEGPYMGPSHRRDAAEHVAHYVLSHPPVTNTAEARQWTQGVYGSPTVHELASFADKRVPQQESYVSQKTGRRVVETLASAVMNDTAVNDNVAQLNQIGRLLTAPALEARNEHLPEGAKLMASQVIDAVKIIRHEQAQKSYARSARAQQAKTAHQPEPRTVRSTVRHPAARETTLAGISGLRNQIDFDLLTRATLIAKTSVEEIKDIGRHARQHVMDLVGKSGNRLSDWDKRLLADAAKRTASMSVQLAAQVPGISESMRNKLKTMALRLGSDEKDSTLAVGQELRDSLNGRMAKDATKLRDFSRDPGQATIQASELIVQWADRQLTAPLTPEQEATRQAYKELVQSIAVSVNGEAYFKGKLPELAPERNFRSPADRSVDLTIHALRETLAPAVAMHIASGKEPIRTAHELIAQSGRATGAERALIVDQLVNLSPQAARELETARLAVRDQIAKGSLDPKALSSSERALYENPRLLEGDLTQRGARLTALANHWSRDGQWLNPQDPADQHRGVAQLSGVVLHGLSDAEKQQTGLERRSEELRQQAEAAAQRVREEQEKARLAAREQAVKAAGTLLQSPQLPGDARTIQTRALRPDVPTR